MQRNSTYSRYLLKEKHRKQYTFTTTKVVVGFCLSVMASIFIGSYFDRYGELIWAQTQEAWKELNKTPQALEPASDPKAPEQPTEEQGIEASPGEDHQIDDLEARVRNLKLSSLSNGEPSTAEQAEPAEDSVTENNPPANGETLSPTK